MVSFRYHLVSIAAVFLALAAGIAMGATVIDRATVDLLRNQISTARAQRNATQHQNEILAKQNEAVTNFEKDVFPHFVDGALSGVPVMIIDVQSIDSGPVKQMLLDAGANVQGQLDFTKAMRLDKTDNTTAQLSQQLGMSGSVQTDDVRTKALERLATWLANPGDTSAAIADTTPVAIMSRMGLVQWTRSAPPNASTRFVVISGATPEVPNEQVAVPFVNALTVATGNRVLAAEGGTYGNAEASPPEPEVREVFTAPLRTDNNVKDRVTTVDNIEDIKGQVALVYALRNLPTDPGRHYGVGRHASDGRVPKS